MIHDVTIFGLNLKLNPIAFTLNIFGREWDIYWYGILIALGFLLAIIYGFYNASRFNLDKDRMLDVVLVVTPIAILCARAYYVIFDGEKCKSIKDFFGFGDSSGFSGLAIYGAVIGAFVSGVLMCKLCKIKYTDIADLAALGFLIGQAVGRWGNFVNQEAFGTFTGSSWWGMQSEETVSYMRRYMTTQAIDAGATGADLISITGEGLVHPCFLYESLWCIAGFILLHFLSKKRRFSGEVVLMYCSWYGLGRGFIEILRTDSLMWGPIKVSCLLGFLACIVGVSLIIYIRKKIDEKAEYVSVFSENTEESEDETN